MILHATWRVGSDRQQRGSKVERVVVWLAHLPARCCPPFWPASPCPCCQRRLSCPESISPIVWVSWSSTWPWAGQKTLGRRRMGRQQGRCCVQRWLPLLLQGVVVGGERRADGAGWREGADERMRVTGRPWWRRGLCPSLCWCFSGDGGLGLSAHAHARGVVDWAGLESLCAGWRCCSGGNGGG